MNKLLPSGPKVMLCPGKKRKRKKKRKKDVIPNLRTSV